ncbi:MAG: nucleotidyltransferase family protein, partial [Thermoproteota archaeon]
DYSIEQMKVAGISKVYIVVGYRKEAVIDYIGNGKRYGIDIAYVYQEERRGNADAVLCVEPFVDSTFCVVFGDDYLEPKTALKTLIDFHLSHEGDGAIGVIPTEDARTTSVVKTDQNNRILDIVEKPDTAKFWTNLGSNGTHVFEPIVFDYIRKTPPGLGNEIYLSDTVKTMVKDGRTVYAVINADFHLDIGVKERYLEVNARIYKNSPR